MAAFTVLVALVGAAGMYAFEREAEGAGRLRRGALVDGDAAHHGGPEYWPRTSEGRLLALLLSVYAVSIFGYLAATLAPYFIDRDAESRGAAVAGQDAVDALRREIAALREEVRRTRPADGGDANTLGQLTAIRYWNRRCGRGF